MAAENWVCAYCGVASLVKPSESVRSGFVYCDLPGVDGEMAVWSRFVLCRNPACNRKTVTVMLGRASPSRTGQDGRVLALQHQTTIAALRLLPPMGAKTIPGFVPEAIQRDYDEAIAIADLSPKAAATLARRALQGMIRDFHKIRKRTLSMEIDALKGRVDPTVWKAIHAVRSVGNIGAHMTKDINIIVEPDPGEASKLLRLIEMLIDDWYVARQRRDEGLMSVAQVGADKTDKTDKTDKVEKVEKKDERKTTMAAAKMPTGSVSEPKGH